MNFTNHYWNPGWEEHGGQSTVYLPYLGNRYANLDANNAVEWNLASGTLPALQENISGANADKLVAEFSYFEPFLGILEYGQYEGQFPDRDFVWYEVAYPDVLNFLQGNATADETLQTIESSVQGSFK